MRNILVLSSVAFLLTLGGRLGLAQDKRPAVEIVTRTILQQTNKFRAMNGLPVLSLEKQLSVIAREHSADMIERNYFSHQNPEGQGPSERVSAKHRRLVGVVGENIAFQSRSAIMPEKLGVAIVESWIASPGHRANLLRRNWNMIGIGVANLGATWTATQVFAEVRGYLRADLPAKVHTIPTLQFEAEPGQPPATLFDLAPVFQSERISVPVQLPSRARQRIPSGQYVLRFYIPNGRRAGSYVIYAGPSVETD